MPLGYEYRCRQCAHDWLMFSKRFQLGPPQWGSTTYTCFTCQTFLSLSTSIDSNLWTIWYSKNHDEIQQNSVTAELASVIDERLKVRKGYVPIELDFPSIRCPNCQDEMSTIPFGEQPMKCPACKQYAGKIQGTDELTIYA